MPEKVIGGGMGESPESGDGRRMPDRSAFTFTPSQTRSQPLARFPRQFHLCLP
jgi:hypothetical protein